MLASRRWRPAVAAIAFVAPLFALACGDDDNTPLSPLRDAAASTDATSERPHPAEAGAFDGGCPTDAPAQEAPIVELVAVAGSPPAPMGGEIVPGKYFLVQSEIYIPEGPVDPDAGDAGPVLQPGPTGSTIQRTLVITEDYYAFSEGEGQVVDSGAPDAGDDAEGGAATSDAGNGIEETDEHVRSYAASGTTITFLEQCPPRGGTFVVPFSFSGDELHLFPSATQHEVLKRQP